MTCFIFYKFYNLVVNYKIIFKSMYYILAIILFIVILWIFLILKFSKSKKLNSGTKKQILKNFNIIKQSKSNKEKIIDFDKLYHKVLLSLGYSWSFWEILKSNPKVISDINSIWEIHKLRNQLVHSFDDISESFLEKKAKEYERIINNLLKKI